jgi:hypothetical protein
VKLAIGTGSAGGVPSGPAGRSSIGGATRVTTGRSDFGLAGEMARATAIGFETASRGSAGLGAAILATGCWDFAFALTLELAAGLATVFGLAATLARAFLAFVGCFGVFDAGRALPDARFFCADLEDFVALAMGVPR